MVIFHKTLEGGLRTILLGSRTRRGWFRGYDALSCLFGNGDHEVVDLFEVDVCHIVDCK